MLSGSALPGIPGGDVSPSPPLIDFVAPDGPTWALRQTASALHAQVHRALKRGFDIAFALLGMVVGLPLILMIVLAIRLTSEGPAFYTQPRVGRGGRPFRCGKFRTMVVDADQRLPALLASSPGLQEEYESRMKLSPDPRLTRIGGFLRRTSLDELPQLWNVLRGEMSIVGPRPLLLDEPDRYGDAFSTVVQVRPGLTGIWQVSGRNAVPYAVRIAMQVEQARQRSLRRDVVIVLRTAVQMVSARSNGAC
jgi:lipopolysaccharide/colanic/teichoic acid biosynthesis glycosyltransferase